MGKDPTPGEQRLEAYLDHWAASYKFEPDLGHRKQPDYLLRTPHGPVLLEVSDFRPDEHDAAIAKTLDERRKSLGPYSYSSAGGVGPDYVPKVRDKIEE